MSLPRSRPAARLRDTCLALAALALGAAAQETGTLHVHLASAPQGGRVRLVLFDSDVSFGRFGVPARVGVFPPGRQDYVLEDVLPGEYALVVHHDEDGDGEFDKNFIGIPSEPIAISNGYRPKGPPVFARARFRLAPGQQRLFELELETVLGPRGRLGVGLGLLSRTSPYAGGDSGVTQPFPAITFVGERLQWFGPRLQGSLLGSDDLRLALTASYRQRAYEEGDSPALAGLGDRDDTLLAGLALIAELPAGFDLSLGYEHDVLGRIGGGLARLRASRTLQAGRARLTPELALNWTGASLADHDFGVPPHAATAARAAYEVGSYASLELGLRSLVELSRDWRVLLDVSAELLPGKVTGSPIVDERTVLRGFLALTYSI